MSGEHGVTTQRPEARSSRLAVRVPADPRFLPVLQMAARSFTRVISHAQDPPDLEAEMIRASADAFGAASAPVEVVFEFETPRLDVTIIVGDDRSRLRWNLDD